MSIKLNGINCFYGAHQALFTSLDCPQGERWKAFQPQRCREELAVARTQPEMLRSGSLSIAGNQSDFTRAPSDKAIQELVPERRHGLSATLNSWPHLTVQQNLIEAPCRVSPGLSSDQVLARAEKLLERLRLKPYSDRYLPELIRRPTTAVLSPAR